MAVHLDIRPRLTFPTEPRVPARGRRRWRLPPLTLPALGYWLAMGALTYGFTRLGPHPLDEAEPTPHQEPVVAPHNQPRGEAEEPLAATAPPPEAQPEVAAEPTAPSATEPPATTAPRAADLAPELAAAPQSNSKPARREAFAGSGETAPRVRFEEPAPRLSFPEFTDSSHPEPRPHAADGPRIDSLFDRAEDRPLPGSKPDATPPPATDPDAPVAVSSCEAAMARNNEQLTIGGPRGAPDVTREAYAGILQNGRYLSACSIPERTVFEICAAVKDGRAVGITITSNPASPALNACVRKAVARLKFPQNSRLDVTHTRFDAVNR